MTPIGHEIHGTGPDKVILCHGWFGDGRVTYGPLRPYLDAQAASYALMDCRGYGRSRDIPGQFSVAEAAADVLALADRLGWDKFHLVGHSMGGKIVQRAAAQAPARVRSLMAITPVPASRLEFDADTAALFQGAVTDDEKRAGIVSFSTGNRLTPVWARAMIADLAVNSTQEAFAGYLKSWSGDDFSDAARGLVVPIKVLVGEFDPTITRAFMEATFGAFYPTVEYETLANAGHYPSHEIPVYLATAIDAFVASHRAR